MLVVTNPFFPYFPYFHSILSFSYLFFLFIRQYIILNILIYYYIVWVLF
jgi:hypothetical protein